jgi:hypothetical protein
VNDLQGCFNWTDSSDELLGERARVFTEDFVESGLQRRKRPAAGVRAAQTLQA